MILPDISIATLQNLLKPHMDLPAWPGVDDPGAIERAREYARATGLWEELGNLEHSTIPAFRYSDSIEFRRTGNRAPFEAIQRGRIKETNLVALALWLDHPAIGVDHLQDLMWAWCETSWAHNACTGLHIDLVSSHLGRTLAEYRWLFRSRLDSQIQARVTEEVRKRLLDVALDWRRNDWWVTTENNWNTVCNSNLILTAFYEIQDPWQLAAFIHPLFRRMDYAIAYFPPDGGCPEGTSYWAYGFGAFIDAALALHYRTGGEINIAAGERMRKICRFPLATTMKGELRASVSDGGHGSLSSLAALKINRLQQIPELYKLLKPNEKGLMPLESIQAFSLYRGELPDPEPDCADYHLPDLGFAKVRSSNAVLAVVGGNNGVSHNHNDLGSFLYLVGDKMILTDPGAPKYSAKTFSGRRYELLFCRSRGHSVPVIEGKEQPAGGTYGASLEVSGLNRAGEKEIRLDLSGAYDCPNLQSFQRLLKLSESGELTLADAFAFEESPAAIEEVFVTFEPVKIEGGRVRIGEPGEAAELVASEKGIFSLEEFLPEEHEGADERIFRRISFVPENLQPSMILSFRISPIAAR